MENSTNPVRIGRNNNLTVVKRVDFGVYLDGQRYGEILLPLKYVPDQCDVGDELEVFIYLDSEDRFVATTEIPYAMTGEVAYLKTVAVTPVGAFVDWGLLKDLLVPYREQKQKLVKGRSYMVYVYFDKASERLLGSTKVHKYIDDTNVPFAAGDEVDIVICSSFELGYFVIRHFRL